MKGRTEFSDVKRRLRPADVFQSADHDWKTQTDSKWVGSCPWHDSSSGTCFKVFELSELKWKCHSCDRGGGPLQYVAELENIASGAHGSLNGKDFFRAWEALSRHAGCAGPSGWDSDSRSNSGQSAQKRRSAPIQLKGVQAPRNMEGVSTKAAGSTPRDLPNRVGADMGQGADTKHSEQKLRKALTRYREALSESERAQSYVRGRGLSVETLQACGCGFAPPGKWLDDDIENENGTPVHRAPNGRIVTPHTEISSSGSEIRLVGLSGRAVEPCPDWLKKRNLDGGDTALFNAAAIGEGNGPLVICEGPMDALSFIEAGWQRTIALHNTDGVPWRALRGNAETLVFAFDRDATGQEDAQKRARGALRRGGFDAHTLHDEAAYEGHGDPNDALQAGTLSLGYLEGLGNSTIGEMETPMQSADPEQPHEKETSTDGAAAEREETAAKSTGSESGQSPGPEPAAANSAEEKQTAADLVLYWDGSDIGHLGRWLWQRGGVPEGDVGAGLYVDRELHKWIKEKLEVGPDGTGEQDRVRLRWVLWRLYAAHGPEDVSERQIPAPPTRRA